MLNIIKQKNKNLNLNLNSYTNNNNLVYKYKDSNYLDIIKHFPTTTKEWCNSIYAYNKNSIKFLPIHHMIITKIIKNYFNLYIKNNKVSKSSRKIRKFKKTIRSTTKKIFVSKAELRHLNDKVIVTLYVYNEQERYILNKLKYLDIISKKHKKKTFLNKIKFVKYQGLKIIKQIKSEKILLDNREKKFIDKFKYFEIKSYKTFIDKSLKKDILKIDFINKLGFNKRKFENTYLLPVNKLLNNVYNKKVEFNLIKLKYFYLNSDIFSEAVAKKIKRRKKLLKIFKASLKLIKLPLSNMLIYKNSYNKLYITSVTGKLKYFDTIKKYIKTKKRYKKNMDVLQQLLQIYKAKKRTSNYVETAILGSIKLKTVNGIRLEASGRLSRRFTASRSLFKVKHKGSLKNINSSNRGIPTVMLRGYARSNLQYTNITSKIRNGSFGLKGWISSQ